MHKYQKIFKKFNISLVPRNNYTFENLINYKPRDKAVIFNIPGIYKIKCKDCERCYIEQTRWNLEIRYKEGMRHVKNKELDKSAVATHKHKFEEEPKLLK